MRLCVASHKECWQAADGRWMSSGGFPRQMEGLASIFDSMTLVVVAGHPRVGGSPLPAGSSVIALRSPSGADARRKMSIAAHLGYYLGALRAAFRSADAVHVPLPGDISLLGLLTALGMGKPLLARYGGSWAGDDETTLMNRVTRACVRRFAGGRNVMLVTGEGVAPPAPGVSWIFSTALTVAELAGIRPATHAELHDPPRLVYAGRLSPEKGVAVLLEALALLRREALAPMPVLQLCGDGPERGTLERLAATLGVADLATFAGQLDRGALGAALLSADLCVQPSRTEGFSKAWLDAMAHGLPVVASDVGAARAVVGADGERGWVTAAGDAPALARRLREVLTSATIDWRALRARCRAHVEGRTLEAWAGEIEMRCTAAWGRPTRGGTA